MSSLGVASLESRLLPADDATRTVLAASATSVVPGATLTLTATVSDQTIAANTPTGGTVTFKDGSTTLATVNLSNGTASFSTTTLSTGKHALSASYGGTGTFASSTMSVSPTSTIITIAGTGTSGSSGDAGQATAAQINTPLSVACDAAGDMFIADSGNNVVRKVTPAGIISSVAGTGTGGYTGDGGQASAGQFNLPDNVAIDAAGDLIVADTYSSAIRKVAAAVNVTVGNPTFTVSGIPSSIVAGTAGSVKVKVCNADGTPNTGYTGAVHFTSSDLKAILPADTTLTQGVGTFNVTFKTAATESITATDTATAAVTASQTGITVTPAAAANFVVAGASATGAGQGQSYTITADDAYGNVATGYTGTVHFTSTDPKAALPADSTLTKGVGTFNVTFKTAGTQAITATDSASPSLTGSQTGIVVTPATASKLTMTGAVNETAGGIETITVTALDSFGNVATGYAGTVHLASSDGQAVLPADSTLSKGVGVFDLTLKTAGTESIGAADTANANLAVSNPGIVVTPAAAARFALTGVADEAAGGVETVTVTAYDAYGNVATGYSGTVKPTSTDPHASYPTTVTPTAGVAQFPFTPVTAGSQTLSVADSAAATVAGLAKFTVSPAAAAALVVTGASGGVAGSVEQVTVTAFDAYGNVATGYNGTLHATSSDPNATLPGDLTLTAGTATVPVTLVKAGTDSVTLTDTQASNLTGSATGIVVTPAATTRFVVGGPAATIAGQGQTYTITATDVYGNFTPDYSGTVHYSSSDLAAIVEPNQFAEAAFRADGDPLQHASWEPILDRHDANFPHCAELLRIFDLMSCHTATSDLPSINIHQRPPKFPGLALFSPGTR